MRTQKTLMKPQLDNSLSQISEEQVPPLKSDRFRMPTSTTTSGFKISNDSLTRSPEVLGRTLTKSYQEFFRDEEEENKTKLKDIKDKLKLQKGQKFLQLLRQRTEKFNYKASHPVFGGYNPNSDQNASKKKFKIRMKTIKDKKR